MHCLLLLLLGLAVTLGCGEFSSAETCLLNPNQTCAWCTDMRRCISYNPCNGKPIECPSKVNPWMTCPQFYEAYHVQIAMIATAFGICFLLVLLVIVCVIKRRSITPMIYQESSKIVYQPIPNIEAQTVTTDESLSTPAAFPIVPETGSTDGTSGLYPVYLPGTVNVTTSRSGIIYETDSQLYAAGYPPTYGEVTATDAVTSAKSGGVYGTDPQRYFL